MKNLIRYGLILILAAGLSACGGGGKDENNNGEEGCDPAAADCGGNLVCEAVQGGGHQCFVPLVIEGQVLDFKYSNPITGALIQAMDPNGVSVGTSGESDDDGAFDLTVPAARNAQGKPVEGTYTLRVQASGYEPFPTPVRPALPVYAVNATYTEGATGNVDNLIIKGNQTTVKLIPVAGNPDLLASISGTIRAESPAGVLVLAEGATKSFAGYSGSEGEYTIFNVNAGSYTVKGYAAGLQLSPASVTVTSGQKKTGVNLDELDQPLNSVTGTVQIVNAPGGSKTSVVLAVESTFIENAARGEVPPGLRAGDITGGFQIEGIPDGRYVVLAAFENDGLVRDPDQTIGGTSLVHIEAMDGITVTIKDGFKVTEALAVIEPGAESPEAVTWPVPVFKWVDDSSEDGYEISVYDTYGTKIWSTEIGSVTGSASVELKYAGPALEEGMFYQFKVSSFQEKEKKGVVTLTRISTTEDLRGVFYYLP